MSTTIDEKVVEMRFDNAKFEQNVSQSMSTLDKLKEKLNFKDSSKGLEEVQKASSKMDFSTLNDGIEKVKVSFSALEVIGVTALANITNSAINSGKQLAKSMSVDQISAGWHKSEEKIASIQTLVNSTGKSLDEIDDYLSQLMWFSDETSYSFTEMVSSLASMTSTGGNIDNLIPTIMGIANATAYAGKGAAEFSRVIFNLNQSYGQGFLSAMDWKSVQQAGVASEALINVLIEEGKKAGTITDDMNVSVGTFASTLQKRWVTSEVMENAFGRLAEFSLAVKDLVDSGEVDTAAEAIDILRDSYDELTVKMFTSAQEAKSFSEAIAATKDAVSSGWMTTFEKIFGNYEETKAFWTEVTNSLWDIFASGAEARNEALDDIMTNNGALKTLKKTLEATGHTMDDFEKELRFVAKGQDINGFTINSLIDEYGTLENAINKVGIPVKFLEEAFNRLTGSEGEVAAVADAATMSLEEMQGLVNAVIRGDWGNGEERVQRLTEAGHSYAAVQTLVNKVWERNGRTWNNTEITVEDLTEAIGLMTDEERKNIGLTEAQIESIDDLIDSLSEGKLSAEEMWNALSKPTGRELLTGSITNVLEAITTFMTVVKTAWHDVFGGLDTGAMYDTINAIHDFTQALILDGVEEDENGDIVLTGQAKRFADALHIVFGAVKVVTDIIGGAFKAAWAIVKSVFKAAKKVFDAFVSVLPEGISEFKNWITNGENIAKVFEKISTVVSDAVDYVSGLITTFLNWEPVQKILSTVYNLFLDIKDVISDLFAPFKNEDGFSFAVGFEDVASRIGTAIQAIVQAIINNAPTIATAVFEIGKNVVLGIINGIRDNAGSIWSGISSIFTGIIDFIKGIFGIHSPSLVMIGIGGMLIAGLVLGLTGGFGNIWQTLKDLGDKFMANIGPIMENVKDFIITGAAKIKETVTEIMDWMKVHMPGIANFFSDLTFGKAMSAGIGVGGIVGLFKLTNVLENFSDVVEGVSAVLNGFAKVEKGIATYLKLSALKQLASGILMIAVSVAILVASLWALSVIDLYRAAKAMNLLLSIIAMITGAVSILMGMSKVAGTGIVGSISEKSITKNGGGLFGALIGLAIAVAAFAIALKIVSTISEADTLRSLGIVGAIVAAITGMITTFLLIGKGMPEGSKVIKQIGSTMLKIAIAMLLMIVVFKLVNKLSASEVIKGVIAMGLVLLFMLALMAIGNSCNIFSHSDPTSGLLKVMFSLILMVLVFKLAGKLNEKDIGKGIEVMGLFLIFVMLFGAVSKGFPEMAGMGGTLMALAACLLIMSISVKILSTLDLGKAAIGVGALVTLMTALTAMLWGVKEALTGGDIPKLIGTFIALGVLLAAMTLCVMLLSILDPADLAQGVAAIVVLTALIGGLLWMVATVLAASPNSKGLMPILIVLTIAIVAMAACVMVLASLDKDEILRGTVAMAAVMLMFTLMLGAIALIVNASGGAKTGLVIAVLAILILFVAGIAALFLVLTPLAQDTEAMKNTMIALAAVMVSLAAVMVAAAVVGVASAAAVAGMLMLIGVLGMLTWAINIIRGMDPISVLPIILLLGVMILSLLPPMIVLASFVVIGPLALAGLVMLDLVVAAAIASMAVLATLVEFIDSKLGKGSTIEIFNYLGDVLHALGEAIGKGLSGLALGLTSDLEEIGKRISAFAEAIQPGVKMISEIKEDLITGAKRIFQLFELIAKSKFTNFIGSIFGSTESLKNNMTAFGESISGFYEKTKDIEFTNVDMALSIAEKMVSTMAAIEPNAGIFSIFSSVDMEKFAADVAAFGFAISAFVISIMPVSAMFGSVLANAAMVVMIGNMAITSMNTLDGYKSKTKIIEDFGADMKKFVPIMTDIMTKFSLNASALTSEIGLRAVKHIVSVMTELENGLPRSGGKFDDWFGSKDLGAFGDRLNKFAWGITDFASIISYHGAALSAGVVDLAMNAAQTLSSLEGNLSTNGGKFQEWFGSKDIGDFGGRLSAFANGICDFAAIISYRGAPLSNTQLIDSAINVAKTLNALETNLPEEKGVVLSWFTSNAGSLDSFGSDIVILAQGICDFAEEIKDLDTTKIDEVLPHIRSLVNITVQLAQNVSKTGAAPISTIVSLIGEMGSSLNTFANNVADLNEEKLGRSIRWLSMIADLALNMNNSSGEAFKNLATGMESLANSGISSFVSALDSPDNILAIEAEAAKIVSILTEKINSDGSIQAIKTSGNDLLSTYISTVGASTFVDQARTKGNNLGQGFIDGMTNKTLAVYNAAYNVGRRAVAGLADAIQSQSPSKEAMKYGGYFGEGFGMGIDSYSHQVSNAASGLGTTAMSSLNNAIAGARDLLENNIDSQPTIRPVLDLSEVQAGANQISGIFASNPYIYSGSRMAGSISRSFIGQNGRNYDMVSAIQGLSEDIVNNSGDSYVINGVSYTEGSDVGEAIKTLANAIVVGERR